MLDSEEITESMRFSYYMLYYYRQLQVHDLDGWGPEELEYLRRHSIEPMDLAGVDLRWRVIVEFVRLTKKGPG